MKILVAMDPTAASQAALEQVAARPWPAKSCFEVISVVEPSHLWTTSEVVVEAEGRAREVVGRAVELFKSVGKEASGVVFTGDPKTVILDRAHNTGADFLVVGSHEEPRFERVLLGSVAGAVLHYAPCSVAVARAAREKADGFRILLATDGSAFSEQAAKSIPVRPWPVRTEVRVLSAVELSLPPARAMFEVPMWDTEFLEAARGEAMRRAQDAVARAREILGSAGLTVSESISVLAETPRSIILKEAADWDADLIVLGSHGRRGMDRFLVGSVSEGVAKQAHCSVDVIR